METQIAIHIQNHCCPIKLRNMKKSPIDPVKLYNCTGFKKVSPLFLGKLDACLIIYILPISFTFDVLFGKIFQIIKKVSKFSIGE